MTNFRYLNVSKMQEKTVLESQVFQGRTPRKVSLVRGGSDQTGSQMFQKVFLECSFVFRCILT